MIKIPQLSSGLYPRHVWPHFSLQPLSQWQRQMSCLRVVSSWPVRCYFLFSQRQALLGCLCCIRPRVPHQSWETGTSLPDVPQISYHYCQVFRRNSPPYPWEEKPCEKAEMTATYLDAHTNFFLLFFSTPHAGNSLFLILLFFAPLSPKAGREKWCRKIILWMGVTKGTAASIMLPLVRDKV